jgi:hypothetical protein
MTFCPTFLSETLVSAQRQSTISVPLRRIARRVAICSIAGSGARVAGIPAPAGFTPEFS